MAPIIYRVVNRALPLTLLCVEGSIAMGPDGTGLFDTFDGKPKGDLVCELCAVADYVLALGTCASYGGIPAAPPNPTAAVGLQYDDGKPGGLLGKDWRSRKGLPVVNVAGCAADTDTMVLAMRWLLAADPLTAIVEGPRVELAARFAAAQRDGQSAELAALSEEFERMGGGHAVVAAPLGSARPTRRESLADSFTLGAASGSRAPDGLVLTSPTTWEPL